MRANPEVPAGRLGAAVNALAKRRLDGKPRPACSYFMPALGGASRYADSAAASQFTNRTRFRYFVNANLPHPDYPSDRGAPQARILSRFGIEAFQFQHKVRSTRTVWLTLSYCNITLNMIFLACLSLGVLTI
jgi:hypothetical protein